MYSKLHSRLVSFVSVVCIALVSTQANAWSLFKKDPPPPPPPTWQDRVKQVWDKSTSWYSEPKEEKPKSSGWGWFKKDPPPPPPTWQDRAKEAWDKTKEWSADKWDKSKEWCSEHKEEIYAGAAVAGAIAVYVLTQDSNSSPSTYNGNGSSSSYNTYSSPSTYNSSPPSYSYESSHSLIAPGRPFSQSQKMDILRQNMERNGGVLRSDLSGKVLVMPKQCLPGVSPSPLEAQIDHVYPRSLGGPNSAENAQVLSRGENIQKSNHVD